MVCTKKNSTTKRYIFSRKGYYSSGGTSWKSATQISALDLSMSGWRYAYGNGLFIAGRNGNISTSTDGNIWTTPTTKINYTSIPNYSNYSLQKLLYLNNTFYAIYGLDSGITDLYFSTSSDGNTWTIPRHEYTSYPFAGMAYGNFFALGDSLVMLDKTGNTSVYSNSRWRQSPLLNANSWTDFIYDGEKYVALGSTGYISTSADLSTWTTPAQDSNLGSHSWVNLVNDGEKLYAFGNTGYMSDDENAIKTKNFLLTTKSNGTTKRYI